jgi:iron complex transport system permease protein
MSWIGAGLVALGAAAMAGLTIGPVGIPPGRVLLQLLDEMPWVSVDAGLSPAHEAIVSDIRLPRVVLGALVGATLAVTGAAYQGAFRNPLADPYLLGVAAGAGLGATIAIVNGLGDGSGALDPVPLAAFAGALAAVGMSFLAGRAGGRSVVSLVLAGVAVASFLTAAQTYVLQRNNEVIREVYSWILGRLGTSGWSEVQLLLSYFVVVCVVLIVYRRALDVLAVGDEEASALGVDPRRIRTTVVVVASLGAAAAVAVSGLIGFVGIIVPHAVRLVVGVSNRMVIPLSIVFGAAFMVAMDLLARTIVEPVELPIGVVTAFVGAPFFVLVLRASSRETW